MSIKSKMRCCYILTFFAVLGICLIGISAQSIQSINNSHKVETVYEEIEIEELPEFVETLEIPEPSNLYLLIKL